MVTSDVVVVVAAGKSGHRKTGTSGRGRWRQGGSHSEVDEKRVKAGGGGWRRTG